jgi:excisionase family DNA binding protein
MSAEQPFTIALSPEGVDALADLIADRVAERLAAATTPEVLTPKQAAVRLGVTTDALRKRLTNGDIKYHQRDVGCKILIPREAIEAYERGVARSSRAVARSSRARRRGL